MLHSLSRLALSARSSGVLRRRLALAAAALAVASLVLVAPVPGAPGDAWAAAGESAAPAQLRRFAFVIGANDGGRGRVLLRYAGSDARAVARVLSELGGVAPADVAVLVDPTGPKLEAGFAALEHRLRAARAGGGRVELLVYYSGHSDDSGLLLSGVRYPYNVLRARIRAMPADVNIAILDSCASGAFTRTKGGTKRPPFILDESSQVRGHAFLSSSSEDEAAQESDRIRGSFFTHYLVSGLRGGADSNRDGRVTLSEAYQFAFDATVARTESTQHGAQHPAYDMHLVGTGDVVMTDLRTTGSALVLAEDVVGTLFIRDGAGRLVVELRKPIGRAVVIGLSPGRYRVTAVTESRGRTVTRGAEAVLAQGARVTLSARQLTAIAAEWTTARGDAAHAANAFGAPGEVGDIGAYEYVPFQFSVIPGIGSTRPGTVYRVSLNLLAGGPGRVEGVEIGGLANLSDGLEGTQIAGLVNYATGPVDGLQIAGLVNAAAGEVDGAQIAGLVNTASGPLDGAQIAGLGNVASGGGDGVQIGGLGNIVTGPLDGVQIGGLGNIAERVDGVQLAGLANVSRGDVDGFQLSGGLNSAARVNGFQLGLLNIGGVVEGGQIGLVNIAKRVDGLQLGLANVAQDSDVPIGLVNLISGGYRAIEVWTSDVAPVSAGFKLGGRRVYTIAAVTANDEYFMPGLGIGVHFPARGYYIDVDTTVHSLLSYDTAEPEESLHGQLRASVGFPLASGLRVFGGVTVAATLDLDETVRPLTLFKEKQYQLDGAILRVHPGLILGLAY